MMIRNFPRAVTLLLGSSCLLLPRSVLACAACFGQSDSQLAVGMNWGIFTLLGFVVIVLGSFAAFLIYLVRKSSEVAEDSKDKPTSEILG